LTQEAMCDLLSRSVDRALTQQGFWLLAFVYMPEHIHLLVFPVSPTGALVSRRNPSFSFAQ